MPNFSANLGFLFTELPFLDRFAAAARAGFKGVEFASPYEHGAGDIARRLADHGLTQALFNRRPETGRPASAESQSCPTAKRSSAMASRALWTMRRNSAARGSIASPA
jgi:hydroxypyruvate isomerase